MALARPEDGRIGDIWRIRGLDHEMVVEKLNRYAITLNSISEPQPSGWGYDLDDWDNVLYRIRENLDEVQVGDVVHLYTDPSRASGARDPGTAEMYSNPGDRRKLGATGACCPA